MYDSTLFLICTCKSIYLGLMIDSNLSWKYHIESICHKISKSIGIIAKIRHLCPSSCFTFSLQLINCPLLDVFVVGEIVH